MVQKLKTAQQSMEIYMPGVTIRGRKRITWIRIWAEVFDTIIEVIKRLKENGLGTLQKEKTIDRIQILCYCIPET